MKPDKETVRLFSICGLSTYSPMKQNKLQKLLLTIIKLLPEKLRNKIMRHIIKKKIKKIL